MSYSRWLTDSNGRISSLSTENVNVASLLQFIHDTCDFLLSEINAYCNIGDTLFNCNTNQSASFRFFVCDGRIRGPDSLNLPKLQYNPAEKECFQTAFNHFVQANAMQCQPFQNRAWIVPVVSIGVLILATLSFMTAWCMVTRSEPYHINQNDEKIELSSYTP